MTTIYFIRHAESDFTVHDEVIRPLTEKGMKDRLLVSSYIEDKDIDIVLSSPYRRAVDTVYDFAQKHRLPIRLVDDFRERKVNGIWVDDFKQFARKQWEDFNYCLCGGESLQQVQNRNVTALKDVLQKFSGKNVVIGTHGTALSTIINYYDHSFGFEDFQAIVMVMPWIVKFTFDGLTLLDIEKIDVRA